MNRGWLAALLLFPGTALAHLEGERPPAPENASIAPVGGWCDALTGEKKAECLRDERRREARESSASRRSCEALMGDAQAACLERERRAEGEKRPQDPGAGATRPAQ